MSGNTGPARLLAEHPLAAAVVFEGALTPLALGLALLAGVQPWADLHPSTATLLLGIGATAALAAVLALLAAVMPGRFRELEALLRPMIEALFRGRGAAPVLLVAALAGLGEELLFRGFLQAWLTGASDPWTGLALASLIFGLVHYLTHIYFVLATAMGLYLGLLYQATGNLLLPVLVHGLYDALAIAWLLRRPGDATGNGAA